MVRGAVSGTRLKTVGGVDDSSDGVRGRGYGVRKWIVL